ncbi:hypothetical protein EAE96_010713 [Botrytis aclada]|nr:hypothetical protein EAE96_010713 [Botrytis aclada]
MRPIVDGAVELGPARACMNLSFRHARRALRAVLRGFASLLRDIWLPFEFFFGWIHQLVFGQRPPDRHVQIALCLGLVGTIAAVVGALPPFMHCSDSEWNGMR